MIGIGARIFQPANNRFGFETRFTNAGYVLDPRLTFTRNSAANDIGSSGALVSFTAHALRTGYDLATLVGRGALIEPAGANGIRNPRAEGATTNTAGGGVSPTLPTNWLTPNRGSGLSIDVSPITAFGMTGLRVRYYGTTSGSPTSEGLDFEPRAGGVACSTGQIWTGSFYYRLSAGAITGWAPQTRLITYNAGIIDSFTQSLTTPDATLRRAGHTPVAFGAATTATFGWLLSTPPANTVCDFTIDVFGPQLEQQPAASSLILPVAGNPIASARVLEILKIDGAAFTQIFGAGTQGTIIMDVLMDSQMQTSAGRMYCQIDDGTTNNRVAWRANSAGASCVVVPVVGGSTNSTVTNATATVYGSTMRVGYRWNGTTFSTCVNGAALSTSATAPSAAMAAIRFGGDQAGSTSLIGRIGLIRLLGTAVSDANFRAYCTVGA